MHGNIHIDGMLSKGVPAIRPSKQSGTECSEITVVGAPGINEKRTTQTIQVAEFSTEELLTLLKGAPAHCLSSPRSRHALPQQTSRMQVPGGHWDDTRPLFLL